MKNLSQMMKQAQEMQTKMAEMQERLAELEVTGSSGGGMIAVTMNGKGLVTGVKIDPALIVPEEAEVLEDLIVAAAKDAKAKAEERMTAEMSELTGGLNLPAGFKLPF
jgi:DNA-binding YbaB/EbfC family protein